METEEGGGINRAFQNVVLVLDSYLAECHQDKRKNYFCSTTVENFVLGSRVLITFRIYTVLRLFAKILVQGCGVSLSHSSILIDHCVVF